MMLTLISKKQILSDYCIDNNVGSSKIQIILLTFRINKLKNHFFIHKKDYHNKRSLLRLIFKRRKLLNYLRIVNIEEYNCLKKELELRH